MARRRHHASNLGFFRSLISADDPQTDSLVICALTATLTLCGAAAYVAVTKGAFDPQGFGIGSGAIIGLLGGGKFLRDRLAHEDNDDGDNNGSQMPTATPPPPCPPAASAIPPATPPTS